MRVKQYTRVTVTHMRSKTATDEDAFLDATVEFMEDGWVHVTGQQPVPRSTETVHSTSSYPRRKVLSIKGYEKSGEDAG